MNIEFTDTRNIYWYAVHVRSRHEFKVLDRLTESGIEAFLPVVERLSRWKDRKKLINFPLFSGYLFVHIHSDNTLPVLKINGVVRLLRAISGEPQPVPEEQIVSLKRVVESKGEIDPYPYLKEGERVRIKSGPLAGLEGILVEKAGNHLLVLSVDILRQGSISKNRSIRSRADLSRLTGLQAGQLARLLTCSLINLFAYQLARLSAC